MEFNEWKQKVFDTVAPQLLKQGVRSEVVLNESVSACRYRGSGNTKCAVGFLIKDEYYNPSLEGIGCGSALIFESLIKSGVFDGVDMTTFQDHWGIASEYIKGGWMSFLVDLQEIHDKSPVESWKETLIRFADAYNIDATCIKGVSNEQ